MDSTVSLGSAGTLMGSPGFSFLKRGEKLLTNAIRSARCWLVRVIHEGMLVITKPRPTELYRSWSVGSVPVGVERHLNTAASKFRGWMLRYGAVGQEPVCRQFSPLPSPRNPWHPEQYR